MFNNIKKKSNKTLMESVETTTVIKALNTIVSDNNNPGENIILNRIKDFWNKNKSYIILGALIFFTIIATYYFSFSNTVNKKISEVESSFSKKYILQKDYCHHELKYYTLSDFYVKSSAKSFLTGFQRYGHNSLNIMKKLLYFGVRYLEINIFSKTFKSETIPVIAPGEKEGEWKLSHNVIDVKAFFKMISQVAFSEKHINNFRDPLFIFINIKTKNIQTLDKVYDYIINSLRDRLLPDRFRNQKQNIGNARMCELMNKLVLFSSDGYQGSKLEKLINASTNQLYLRRITFSELNQLINRENDKDENKADFLVKSSYVEFKKGAQNDYIQIYDSDINFIEFGLTNKFVIKISGAKNPENNVPVPLSIKDIKQDKIYFKRNNVFTPEKRGSHITITGYDLKYGTNSLEKLNRSNLTIVVPDEGLLSKNFNFYKPMKYGCQFVCMFYHNLDYYLKNYNNFFNNFTFKLKPQVLRNKISKPKETSVYSLYPGPQRNANISIDYDFIDNFREVKITPYKYNDAAIINHKNIARISPNHNSYNSLISIVPGLNGKQYSISFKLGDKYLVNGDKCCFLFFVKRPKSASGSQQFDNDSTFYPTKPLCNMDGYHSFVISKDREYNLVNPDKKIPDYEKIYYLRYKTSFIPQTKLYKHYTMFYIKVITLEGGTPRGPITIWRPSIKNNYYPIGDIAIKGTKMPEFKTIILAGGVAKPNDYELVYDNKLLNESYKLSIWKAIPPDGYIAMGYVFNPSYDKPSINEIACVRSEYLNPKSVSNDYLWKNVPEGNADFLRGTSLSFWNVEGSDYVVVNNSIYKPSEFDTPGFTINTNEKDFTDRLYLDKFSPNDEDIDSACFKVYKEYDRNKVSDNAKIIISADQKMEDFKIISQRADDEGNNVCVSLHTAQWTPFYKEPNSNTPSIFGDIEGEINNRKFIAQNTNKLNKDDYFYINYLEKPGVYKNYMNGKVFQVLNKSNYSNNKSEITFSDGIEMYTLIKNKPKRWVKVFNYINKNDKIDLDVLPCREIDYAGTNWTHHGDNSIRFSTNPKYCLNNDTDSDIINIKECDYSYNQKFMIQDKKILKMKNESILGDCMTNDYKTKKLILKSCDNTDISQNWTIKKSSNTFCLSIGKQIYLYCLVPRGKKFNHINNDGIYLDKRINEEYDFDNYHVYIRGEITGERGDKFLVKLYNKLDDGKSERQSVYKRSKKLVSDAIPSEDMLSVGTEVICKNGDLNIKGYTDDYIKWKGIITKKINQEEYNVLFSINSVELDKSRDKLGRKTYVQEKKMKIFDIRILKKMPLCKTLEKVKYNETRICNRSKLLKKMITLQQAQNFKLGQGIDSQRYSYTIDENSCDIKAEPEVEINFNCDTIKTDDSLLLFLEKKENFQEESTNDNGMDINLQLKLKIISQIDSFERELSKKSSSFKRNLKEYLNDRKKTFTNIRLENIKKNADSKIRDEVYQHMITATPNFYDIYKHLFN